MGRNKKIGLDYFPFDVDFFDDIKVRKLIKYQGCKSISVYALLLCNIYKNGYYLKWDEELPFIISEKTGYEEAYILEVIKCCLSVGLFSKELYAKDKILTSKGIQERYAQICSTSRRLDIIAEFSLINTEEMPISAEKTPINSVESAQTKQNKIKVNNNPPISPKGEVVLTEVSEIPIETTPQEKNRKKVPAKKEMVFDLSFVPERWMKIMEDWLEYRKSIKKPYKTQQGVEQFYAQLIKLSDNDGMEARKIINKAIANEWQGIGDYCKEKSANGKSNSNIADTKRIGDSAKRRSTL